MVLDVSLLNTQHYKVRIKGKCSNPKKSCIFPYLFKRQPSGRSGQRSPTLLIYILTCIHIYAYAHMYSHRRRSFKKFWASPRKKSHSWTFLLWLQKTYTLYHSQKRTSAQYQAPCTVKHFYIECKVFIHIRKRLFNVNNVKDLFENINIHEILSFFEINKIVPKI